MTPETRLRTLSGGDLRLACCACGHEASLPITAVTSQLGIAATLGDLLARIRCQRCGAGDPVVPTQASDTAEPNIAEEKTG